MSGVIQSFPAVKGTHLQTTLWRMAGINSSWNLRAIAFFFGRNGTARMKFDDLVLPKWKPISHKCSLAIWLHQSGRVDDFCQCNECKIQLNLKPLGVSKHIFHLLCFHTEIYTLESKIRIRVGASFNTKIKNTLCASLWPIEIEHQCQVQHAIPLFNADEFLILHYIRHWKVVKR